MSIIRTLYISLSTGVRNRGCSSKNQKRSASKRISENISIEYWCNCTGFGRQNYSEQNPVLAPISSPKILILLGLRLTKGLRGDRSGTNRRDHKETCLANSGFRWEFTDSSAKPGYGGRSFHRNVVTTLQST